MPSEKGISKGVQDEAEKAEHGGSRSAAAHLFSLRRRNGGEEQPALPAQERNGSMDGDCFQGVNMCYEQCVAPIALMDKPPLPGRQLSLPNYLSWGYGFVL
ncbi:hypothetical protein EYF80_009071 [Liparis tanakae]|uniref:Uncharacterized protein n=1 Tax=Liparis tanakae TaxID=230148 RepID=A0A4Z2IRS7_9TELE|nr:hypothetical protein EYF80_009071 [Liparis tanakae]